MMINNRYLVASLFVASFLCGCTSTGPYHATKDAPPDKIGQLLPQSEDPKAKFNSAKDCEKLEAEIPDPAKSKNDKADSDRTCIAIVEYDEFGHLFNRSQLDQTISTANKVASMKTAGKDGKIEDLGGIIIVYVHGWRHNANPYPEDQNLRKFKETVDKLGRLDQVAYKDNRRIMGIYVGWRGASIETPYAPFLEWMTFWDRKNVAQAVGNGAVFELFKKLSLIRANNPSSRLVIVGHSFGAAVVYSSVWNAVLSQIIEDPKDPTAPKDPEDQIVSPTPTAKILTEAARKRWDMIVLINPAFEALQVRSHYEAARSRHYVAGQIPHLIFVTSKADFPTRVAFPTGRGFSTIFKSYGDQEVSPEMNVTAIGHYIPYVTHQLNINTKCNDKPTLIKHDDNVSNVLEAPDYCFADTRGYENITPPYIVRCDKEGLCKEVADNHFIVREGTEQAVEARNTATRENKISAAPTPVRMPIMNIRTTADMMKNHNDIWNDTMQSFLVQFLLLTVAPPSIAEKERNVHLKAPEFPVPTLKQEKTTLRPLFQ